MRKDFCIGMPGPSTLSPTVTATLPTVAGASEIGAPSSLLTTIRPVDSSKRPDCSKSIRIMLSMPTGIRPSPICPMAALIAACRVSIEIASMAVLNRRASILSLANPAMPCSPPPMTVPNAKLAKVSYIS